MTDKTKKVPLAENRTLAVLVLCVVVVVAIVGIGGAKLEKKTQTAVLYYAENIANDYNLRVQAAQQIVQVAQGVLPADDAGRKAAEQALEQAQTANTPAQQCAAGNALQAGVGMLYETLRTQLNSEKGSVLQTQWSEFLSRGNIIANSSAEYNALARKAQEATKGFPAGLLAKMRGITVSEYAA